MSQKQIDEGTIPELVLPVGWHEKAKLFDKLKASPKEAVIRFTIDMPESMHKKLSILAAKTGRKKVDIVRIVLAEILQDIDG